MESRRSHVPALSWRAEAPSGENSSAWARRPGTSSRERAERHGRAGHDGEVREAEERLRLLPRIELHQRVLADQEHGTLRCEPLAVCAQRLDRVRHAATLDLEPVDAEAGVPGDGHARPFQPARRGGHQVVRRGLLVRRRRARDEDHAFESQQLGHVFGGAQMGDVDRVEGAARAGPCAAARPRASFAQLALALEHELERGETLEAHGSVGVELRRGDPDLRAETRAGSRRRRPSSS